MENTGWYLVICGLLYAITIYFIFKDTKDEPQDNDDDLPGFI